MDEVIGHPSGVIGHPTLLNMYYLVIDLVKNRYKETMVIDAASLVHVLS
jgi:hypothetical protein